MKVGQRILTVNDFLGDLRQVVSTSLAESLFLEKLAVHSLKSIRLERTEIGSYLGAEIFKK